MDAKSNRTLPVWIPAAKKPAFATRGCASGLIEIAGGYYRRLQATARPLSLLVLLAAVLLIPASSDAGSFRTRNFIIDAPSGELARTVGEAAERFRDELAVYWTGETLPPWPRPCPVRVVAGANLAAQGVTTYNPAPVRDFQMEVIGTPERILDSVLPHEVTHTVLATYFGRPLPRWADEGICTTVEHASERAKHEAKLREFLASRRGIAMNRLFLLTEYPPDVLPMYAQGYSVCRFLIEQQGPQEFIQFLKDYMRHQSWTANVQKHYGYESLAELQEYWLSWVEAGSGPVAQFAKREVRAAAPDDSLASREIITRDAAPATALAAASEMRNQRGDNRSQSLVAANDRGRVSEKDTESGWYHRRVEGRQSARGRSRTKALEELPPGKRVAVSEPAPSPPSRTEGAGRSAPSWAPPSVMSSGRYSAATPQPETTGTLRR